RARRGRPSSHPSGSNRMSLQSNVPAAGRGTLAFDRTDRRAGVRAAPRDPVAPYADTAATEAVACYACGSTRASHFIEAEDDLTGKPGRFRFVRCDDCALVYQNPRIPAERIADWYDD